MATPPVPEGDEYPKEDDSTKEIFASPPSDRVLVSDTARLAVNARRLEAAAFVGETDADGRPIRVVYQSHEELHAGPLPAPNTLRQLAEIYPDAPRLIFEDFHAQSAHRRDIERDVILTKNKLALRGQSIGGVLGGIGLVGSLVVAGVGQGWAGFGIAMTSLGSLVSIFVIGRESQRKELVAKEKIRKKIAKGTPVEEMEAGKTGSRSDTHPDAVDGDGRTLVDQAEVAPEAPGKP